MDMMQQVIEANFVPAQIEKVSRGQARTGWIVTGVLTAFLVFDIVSKFAKPAPVVEAFTRTGWPIEMSVPIGVILLVCTVFYLIPRTAVFGAILLTGYLGGAVATNMRLENPLFSHTLFPVYFGILAWIGLWLREGRIRSVFPLLNPK